MSMGEGENNNKMRGSFAPLRMTNFICGVVHEHGRRREQKRNVWILRSAENDRLI
jgi:hypothetical protein